jgi:uncharacterized protein
MAWVLPDDCVLGILGEKPEPDHLNPTFSAEWGPDFASELHEAMLFDTLEAWAADSVLAPGGRRVLVYAPADAGPWFDARVPASFAIQPRDEREPRGTIHAFFAGEMAEGASRVVMIGSDAPTLDPTLIVSAFLCLESRDIVAGPATDGGLYLVGARGSVPNFLEGLEWKNPRALSQSIDRLEDTGLSLSLLPPWYRVNQPAEVRTLVAHVRALRRSGLNPGLPRLESLIDNKRFWSLD